MPAQHGTSESPPRPLLRVKMSGKPTQVSRRDRPEPATWTPRSIGEPDACVKHTLDEASSDGGSDQITLERGTVERCFEQAGISPQEALAGVESCADATQLRGRFVAVSATWWSQWKSWTGFFNDRATISNQDASSAQNAPGPVSLADSTCGPGNGVPSIDFVWIPEEAWRALQAWHAHVPTKKQLEKPSSADAASASDDEYRREEVVFYEPQNPATPRSPASSPAVARKRRSSSIYEAFDLPKDPQHWDAKWSHLAVCRVRPGSAGARDCLSCCDPKASKVCGKCRRARYCSVDCQASAWRFHRKRCSPNMEENQFRGLVGLRNLGNTCYMNSTLQCLSNCWPLTRYFLSNKFRQDRNLESVLGTGARFAMVWDSLIKELWFGSSPTITPVMMKRAIGTLPGSGGQFAGFMQHDAQELLIFLLDTLHEDLNLVHIKPYFAEVDNVSDPPRSIADLAAESWAKHLRREHSMVTHIFQGQLHNTVACPRCKFESHTFTPFMFLPLAIPVDRDRIVTVTVVRQVQDKSGSLVFSRVRYAVGVRAVDSCRHLKSKLAELCGVAPAHQLLVQLRHHAIVRDYTDNESVRLLLDPNCELYMYELADPALLEVQLSSSHKRGETERLNASTTAENGSERRESRVGSDVREIFVLHRSSDSPEAPTVGLPLLLRVSASRTCLEVRMAISRLLRLLSTGLDTRDASMLEREGRALRLRFVDHNGEDIVVEGCCAPADHTVDETSIPPGTSDAMSVDDEGEEEGKEGVTCSTSTSKNGSDLAGSDASVPAEMKSNDADVVSERHGHAEEMVYFPDDDARSLEDCVPKAFFVLAAIWDDQSQTAESPCSTGKSKKDRKRTGAAARKRKKQRNKKKVAVPYQEAPTTATVQHESARTHEARVAHQSRVASMHRVSGEIYSLHECLEFFSNRERLGTGNAWSCPKCKTDQEADKTMRIIRLPEVLILCLKRFEPRSHRKIMSLVDFPLEELDLAPFLADFGGDKEKEDTVFDLFAVTNHMGTAGMGHYTAHVARQESASSPVAWYLCDDSSITEVRAASVVSSSAYCLYYKRRRSEKQQQ